MFVVRQWLWSSNGCLLWVVVRWSWVVGPTVVVLILGCGSWFDGHESWVVVWWSNGCGVVLGSQCDVPGSWVMVLIVVVVMGCNSWVTVPSCVLGSCRLIWMVATMMGGYGDCGMGGCGCGGFFFFFFGCLVVAWVVGLWWLWYGWWVFGGWWVLWWLLVLWWLAMLRIVGLRRKREIEEREIRRERKNKKWIKNNKEIIFKWSVKKNRSFDIRYIVKCKMMLYVTKLVF